MEARYYKAVDGGVKCLLCPHECQINEGKHGICRSRECHDGKLYSLAYGEACALHVDPVEKKPLLHFLPGSQCLSIAAAGCNLSCKNCQNWEISQISPSKIGAEKISPADFIRIAKRTHCKSVAYTYTEPLTYMEYTQDCAKLAREYGLRNILVTAGYVNEEPLRELTPYLDAVNVDLKSFDDAIYKEISHAHLAPVLRTLEILRDDNVWIEIINLLIPGVNDDMQMVNSMCHWLINNGFDNYPLHFSRFFPAYKLKNVPPTPEETLIEAKNIACEAGIKFVYIGNIDLDDGETTHCPSCGVSLIHRDAYDVIDNHIIDARCSHCSTKIPGMWE